MEIPYNLPPAVVYGRKDIIEYLPDRALQLMLEETPKILRSYMPEYP